MKNLLQAILYLLLGAFIGFIIYGLGYYTGSNKGGYGRGFRNGVDRTLDTMLVIIDKQVKSDTSASKLVIKDTVTYYLSRKTLLK